MNTSNTNNNAANTNTTTNTTSTIKATTMNTQKFLTICIARIQENTTWNHDQLRAALGVVYKKNPVDPICKEEIGKIISAGLASMKENLNNNGSKFCSTTEVLEIFNASLLVTPEEVVATTRYVSVFTDGSCKDGVGGWGVHIKLKDSKVSKQLKGHLPVATNNTSELQAMVRGINAVDFTKEGFVIKFITDSRYVLQTILNERHYLDSPTKLKANREEVMELLQALQDKGVVLDSHPRGILAAGGLRSGQVVVTANSGKVEFKWVKGHNGLTGNEAADRLATQGRLEGLNVESEVTVPEEVQESVVELSEMLNKDYIIVTESRLKGDDIHFIKKASPNQREYSVSEDFCVITERFYSDARAEQVGIPLLDLAKINQPTERDLQKAKRIILSYKDFDFAYQNSDDNRVFARNTSKKRVIDSELAMASTIQKDLVNLYINHILEVREEFRGPVVMLPNTKEEALKYFG